MSFGSRTTVGAVLLAALCLVGACAPKPRTLALPEVGPLVWPAPPLPAKVEWIKEIAVLDDSGSSNGFWGRMQEFLLGNEVTGIVRSYGVCTDQKDLLFIADPGSSRVHVYDMVQNRYRAILGTPEVPLAVPIGVVAGNDGSLYITDAAQGAILRCTVKTGELRPFTPDELIRPTGITLSPEQNLLYVTDTGRHQVVVFDLGGVERFRFGERGTELGQFNYPTDLWVDGDGLVYVTDALNARIQTFSAHGEYLSSFGEPGDTPGSFSKPKGVAVDRCGHIFVADALFDAVQIFDQSGKLMLEFGENGSKPGAFWMPSGIFIDQQDFIYVSDTYNRRIQIFRHYE